MAIKSRTIKKSTTAIQTFKWDGRDNKGKKLSGEIRAKDINLARTQLRKQNIVPIKVTQKKDSIISKLNEKPIKSKDITYFTRQLSTMIDAGVPIVQGLEIIGGDQSNPTFKKMVDTIRGEVESGSSLSDGLKLFPKYFDPLYINLIKVGEGAGILEEILQGLANYREKTESLKAKVKKAMIYPASVVFVAIAVTSIILLYVIPQFEQVFASANTTLPMLTRAVIGASHFMAEWGWLLIVAVIALVGLMFTGWKRSEKFQRTMGQILLRLPVLGKIMHQASLARFSRTLSTTFGAGLPIVDSLTSVSQATGNAIYSDAVIRMRDGVTTGQSLHFAMAQEKLFPNLIQQMTTIGEESGSLETLLGKIADYYEEAVDNAVDSLNSLLEPMIIVFLGTVVGILVIAMYMPIFQLGNVVG